MRVITTLIFYISVIFIIIHYIMKKLFNKLNPKTLVQLLVKNTLTQIMVLGSIMVISAILGNYFDWAYYTMFGSVLLLSLIAVIYIVSAWVINPIKELFNKKNQKREKND